MIADIARELGPFWFTVVFLACLGIAGLAQENRRK